MRGRYPKPPQLGRYIPKKLLFHVRRLKKDFETVRSWSQKYPYLPIPISPFKKLDNSYEMLIPKLEAMIKSAEQHNQRLQKSSSRQTDNSNTKRPVSAKTASRDSGSTPWADGEGTWRGWLGDLSNDSETSSELLRSLLLHRRSFEHSFKEDFDYTVHLLEVKERAENPENDKLTMNAADSRRTGVGCRSEKSQKPSVAPTISEGPISERLKWSLSDYNVFHGKGLMSTIFSNLMALPQSKVERLELVDCGPKDSGHAEEHILELLDLAIVSYLQDLSREESLNGAQAISQESLLPTYHAVLFLEVPTLESEDAEIMHEAGKSQIQDVEGGRPDLAGKSECDGARLGQTQIIRRSDEVQRTTVIKVNLGYKSSTIQSLNRADTVRLIYLATSGKNLRQVGISSFATGLVHAKELINRELLVRGKCRCGAKH